MNFSAIVPVAHMQSANQALEAQGFGPDNFSVPAFTGASPSHAMFHAWSDPIFEAAVAALPNVTIQQDVSTPLDTVVALAGSVGASWVGSALPLEGVVSPGLHFRMVDNEPEYWQVIQQYDTAIWPDPTQIPALIMMARMPGVATVWRQPLGAFDAYPLIDEFTGSPIQVTHNGQVWNNNAASNVWEPGVFGWVLSP